MSLCFYSFTKSRRRTVIPLTRSCSFRFVKQTLLPTNISYKTKELKSARFQANYSFTVSRAKEISRTIKAEQNFQQWRMRSA